MAQINVIFIHCSPENKFPSWTSWLTIVYAPHARKPRHRETMPQCDCQRPKSLRAISLKANGRLWI